MANPMDLLFGPRPEKVTASTQAAVPSQPSAPTQASPPPTPPPTPTPATTPVPMPTSASAPSTNPQPPVQESSALAMLIGQEAAVQITAKGEAREAERLAQAALAKDSDAGSESALALTDTMSKKDLALRGDVALRGDIALRDTLIGPTFSAVPAGSLVRLDINAYEPRDWREAYAIAEHACKSGLVPYKNPSTALVVMMTGRELGLKSMQALRSIYVVDGKPSLSAELRVALVLNSGLADYFDLIETTAAYAIYVTKRKGSPREQRHIWTSEMAHKAGLEQRKNWRSFPDAMLRARCALDLARAVYPDVGLGLYDPDELGADVRVYVPGDRELPIIDVAPVKSSEEIAAEMAKSAAVVADLFGEKK